nr:hypothetical protein [Spirochaetales bacterium]
MITKKFPKLILLLVSLVLFFGSAFNTAATSFNAYVDNPDNIRVFDANGILVRDISGIDQIREGWIIQTLDSDLELTLQQGALKLAAKSILSIDSFSEDYVDLYLLRGKARVVSDSLDTKVTLATSTGAYSFQKGELILVTQKGDTLYGKEGVIQALNFISGKELIISPNEKMTASGSTAAITQAPQELAQTAETLPLEYYRKTILTARKEPVPEPEPVVEPEPVPEPEPVVEPEPAPEPEPVVVEPQDEIVVPVEDIQPAPQPEEAAEQPRDVQLPPAIELKIPAASEPKPSKKKLDYPEDEVPEQRPRNIDFTLNLGTGLMHKFTSSELPYITTAFYPTVLWNDLDLGFRVHIAFQGTPAVTNWYAPYGDLLWNYGGGFSGSELVEDILRDSLSLIDHVHYGEPGDLFYLRIDDSTPLTLGLGTHIRNLDTSIDYPYFRRTGLYNEINTRYVDFQMLVDDITYARLFGLRTAFTPLPDTYAFTVGLYAAADIDISKGKIVMTPGIDLTLPLISEQNSD